MKIWFGDDSLATIRSWVTGTMVEHLGIEITGLGDDWIEGTMPVDSRTVQPYGVVHGGASVALAETLGSYAANLVLDRSKRRAVGQEIGASHLRPVSSGKVTGRATPLHLGARSQVWTIEMRNDAGQRTCVARLTMAVLDLR
jgi:1,4-dihydroxy-2-naphthoyl-CoA hydrolase